MPSVVTLEKMFPGGSNLVHGIIWAVSAAAFFTMVIAMVMGAVAAFYAPLPAMARVLGAVLAIMAPFMAAMGLKMARRLLYGPPVRIGKRSQAKTG
jgi:hypothetical protein